MKPVIKLFPKMLLWIMAALFVFTSCGKPQDDPDLQIFTSSNLQIDPYGETVMLDIHATQAWKIEMTFSSDDEWLVPDKTSGSNGNTTVEVQAQPNYTGASRTASMQISTTKTTVTVRFTQEAGEAPSFMLLSQNATVSAEGGLVEVELMADVPYDFSLTNDWVREVESKASTKYRHTFEVDPNPTSEQRKAVISFCADGSCIPYTITQEAAE